MSLVGLRVGASLAAAVAAERKDLDRIVLGTRWSRASRMSRRWSSPSRRTPVRAATEGRDDRHKGFPLTSRMRQGLEHIDLRDLTAPASGRMIMTVSDERAEFVALMRWRSQDRADVSATSPAQAIGMRSIVRLGTTPQSIIQGIVACLTDAELRRRVRMSVMTGAAGCRHGAAPARCLSMRRAVWP